MIFRIENRGASMVSKKSKPLKRVKRKVVEKPFEDNPIFWKGLTIVLGVVVILSIITGGFRSPSVTGVESDLNKLLTQDLTPETKNAINAALESLQSIKTQEPSDDGITPDGAVTLTIINDKKCEECLNIGSLIDQLKASFTNLQIKEYDFEDKEGRQIYDELELEALPAFLFDQSVKESSNYPNFERYFDVKGDYLMLRIGANHNPLAEICDNNVDDRDQDGLIDCADDECSSQWQCMEKKEIPEVELFVMSHCPFGTQIEKGILPVVELLGNKIDFNVRFVYYAMHGEQEVREEARQYCIQKEQNDKYLDYLKCFLEAGNSEECLVTAKIDTDKLDSCVEQADEEFDITANLEDTSSWLSGSYPLFNTDLELNQKYDVGGSPTLVINGVVASVARDPASLLDAICTGFEEKPTECSEELSSLSYGTGFGFTQAAQNTDVGSCG